MTLPEHIRWLRKTLKSTRKMLYIAEQNGMPVGTVRVEYCEDACELSWTVAPSKRGQGVGIRMVQKLVESINTPIHAKIKAMNTASIHIAENIGMRLIREENGMLFYERESKDKTQKISYDSSKGQDS